MCKSEVLEKGIRNNTVCELPQLLQALLFKFAFEIDNIVKETWQQSLILLGISAITWYMQEYSVTAQLL